jgi:DNA repair exonuclease SbcCD ATPase subunit
LPKKRERNEAEWYRAKVRELEKENKHLHRRIKELEKHAHMYEQGQELEEASDTEDTPRKRTCPDCGKGKLDVVSIVGRVFESCDLCDYRKKIGQVDD